MILHTSDGLRVIIKLWTKVWVSVLVLVTNISKALVPGPVLLVQKHQYHSQRSPSNHDFLQVCGYYKCRVKINADDEYFTAPPPFCNFWSLKTEVFYLNSFTISRNFFLHFFPSFLIVFRRGGRNVSLISQTKETHKVNISFFYENLYSLIFLNRNQNLLATNPSPAVPIFSPGKTVKTFLKVHLPRRENLVKPAKVEPVEQILKSSRGIKTKYYYGFRHRLINKWTKYTTPLSLHHPRTT